MSDIVIKSNETNSNNITNEKISKYPRRPRRRRKNKINGVYQITNKINGKFYIGSSMNILDRWDCHKARLKVNKHKNAHLQNSVNKYGIENFEFSIIERFDSPDPMLGRNAEQKLLDIWFGNEKCYNLNAKADKVYGIYHPMYGRHHTQKVKDKLSRLKKQIPPDKHPMFIKTIYSFKNERTNETFTGTYYDFCRKYGLHLGNVSRMIRRDPKVKTVKKWSFICEHM